MEKLKDSPSRHIGSRRELFVDQFLTECLDGAALKLHETVSGGVAIRIDKPWEGPGNFGTCVLHQGGQYLMYYRAMTVGKGEDGEGLCVALSQDGIVWPQPSLCGVGGSRDANIVALDDATVIFDCNSAPWIDTRPGVPQSERFKAITSEPLSGERHTAFVDPSGPKRLGFWGSADGFSFHRPDPQPEFVSHLRN